MQHYQLASEMLLLAEEYRDPSSSACAGLVDAACTGTEENDTAGIILGPNAEAALNFMMDYISALEEEYDRSLLMTSPAACSTAELVSKGTPLPFALSTSPNEQAEAVFYNMSLGCVLLGDEDRAVDFLAMVEELCLDSPSSSSSSSPATGSSATDSSYQVPRTQQEEPTPRTYANANANDRRADLELLALSVVSSAKVPPSPDKDGPAAKVRVVDTGTLLQVGRSHAIRSNQNPGAEDGGTGTDPLLSSSCSVPTVLPSYEKDALAMAGASKKGGKHPGDKDSDGSECGCADDEDDCLSQSSEPCRRRFTVS